MICLSYWPINQNTGAGMKKTTKSFAYDRVFGRFATQGT